MMNARLPDLPNGTNDNLSRVVHLIETSWIDVVQMDKSKMLILTTGQFASLSHSKFLGSTIRSSVCTMKKSEDTAKLGICYKETMNIAGNLYFPVKSE
jgi:hypothetical protein